MDGCMYMINFFIKWHKLTKLLFVDCFLQEWLNFLVYFFEAVNFYSSELNFWKVVALVTFLFACYAILMKHKKYSFCCLLSIASKYYLSGLYMLKIL